MSQSLRRFLMWQGIILLGAFLPVLSVALSSTVASSAGCALNEGSAHPCVILGFGFGNQLYAMFVFGWMMLVTLPAGAAVWLLHLLAGAVFLYKRRTSAVQQGAAAVERRVRWAA